MQIEDAFGFDRRFPMSNFTSGGLGHCWALAKFERLALLLGRTDQTVPANLAQVEKYARGFDYSFSTWYGFPRISKVMNTQYSVFKWPSRGSDAEAELLDSRVKSALQLSQTALFYRGSNLRYVLNLQTEVGRRAMMTKVIQLAKQHALPMLNLRFGFAGDHVVLVSEATQVSATDWNLKTIDSNSITGTDDLYVRVKDGRVRFTYSTWESTDAVNVFLIGEEERPAIDAALMSHYTQLCAQPD